MITFLQENTPLPSPDKALADGLLAVGGSLNTSRLTEAYSKGIFPWYSSGEPIMWWSPDPRMVLFPEEFKLSKSLSKTIKKEVFQLSFNTSFKQVIAACASVKRKGQLDTWITLEMEEAYCELHREGLAKSVEVWQKNKLVGGLYGVDLKEQGVFCGESMFSVVSDASKVAFYFLVNTLKTRGYKLIDCQMHTAHLASLGAREVPRKEFLNYLKHP